MASLKDELKRYKQGKRVTHIQVEGDFYLFRPGLTNTSCFAYDNCNCLTCHFNDRESSAVNTHVNSGRRAAGNVRAHSVHHYYRFR